jgi:hypothetical protein
VGVESGKLRVKSEVWKVEWKVEKVVRENYVIEIKQAVVRCSLIASGNHVSPPTLVTVWWPSLSYIFGPTIDHSSIGGQVYPIILVHQLTLVLIYGEVFPIILAH